MTPRWIEIVRPASRRLPFRKVPGPDHGIRLLRNAIMVGSRAGAPTLGSGGQSTAFAVGLSPAPLVYVSSSRHLARSVRVYRTTRSCTILIKGYGTYHTGAAFDVSNRARRYPLKSPTRSTASAYSTASSRSLDAKRQDGSAFALT